METLVARCAGLDVHKDSVTACVRVPDGHGGRHAETRRFTTTTAGLVLLAQWLGSFGVTRVGMESTGCYWKPVWQLLEDQLECWLLNAAHLHNVPGRKTDVADSAWIAIAIVLGVPLIASRATVIAVRTPPSNPPPFSNGMYRRPSPNSGLACSWYGASLCFQSTRPVGITTQQTFCFQHLELMRDARGRGETYGVAHLSDAGWITSPVHGLLDHFQNAALPKCQSVGIRGPVRE
jgi:hypothetical protein